MLTMISWIVCNQEIGEREGEEGGREKVWGRGSIMPTHIKFEQTWPSLGLSLPKIACFKLKADFVSRLLAFPTKKKLPVFFRVFPLYRMTACTALVGYAMECGN